MAACQGGRLVVHFTNRKNAPLLFFHTNRDATASDDLEAVFKEFRQVGKRRRREMALASAWRCVESSSSYAVESDQEELGAGSTFTFTLPLSR